jgi:hypothetical protein
MAFPKEGAFAGTDRQVFTNGSPGRFSDRQQRRNRQLLGRVDHLYLHEGGKDVVVINASARLNQAGLMRWSCPALRWQASQTGCARDYQCPANAADFATPRHTAS